MTVERGGRSLPASGAPARPRVGIVGAGLMGRWHAAASRLAGGDVVAVVDRDPRAAMRVAQRSRGARTFADLDQLLRAEALDVVHICTPTATHAEFAHAAIAAGVNVIVEKPLTTRAQESERLFDSAAARGVLLCPTYQMAFQDGVLKAKRLLPHIGTVVHAEAHFYSGGGERADPQSLDAIIAEIAPHPLSLALTLLPGGLPDSAWQTVRPRVGELRALTSLGDVSLSISMSMHARPPLSAFTIVGSRGTIEIDLFHGYAFMVRGGVSRVRKVASPFLRSTAHLIAATTNLGSRMARREPAYPGLRRLVASFYAAVQGRTGPPLSPAAVLAIERTRHRLLAADRESPR